MSAIPKSLSRLIESLARLPGVGSKTAERLAFYILRSPKEYADSLIRAIMDVKKTITFCKSCNSLSEGDLCDICSDPKREKSLICIVENPNDIIAIEKTGQYNGRYFCLMGALSPLDSIGPEDLKIDSLSDLLKREKIKEAIIATDSDQEGDMTALYLSRVLGPLGVKLTRIAFGIPVGSNIEYADRATLTKAFEGRRQF
ncbi:MAG: recombination protein RecR [Candidatus Omnitrophica bacterium]|nr:recombination protein RecR [Candidatus Omnitrophota bacterium]